MYISSCDGKANSKQVQDEYDFIREVTQIDGTKRNVIEFLHNDFEPCFEAYDAAWEYCSKIERAWNAKTFLRDPEWDQVRRLETWNGKDWDCIPGKKWGYFRLERYKRVVKKKIINKALNSKFNEYFSSLPEEEVEERLCDIDSLKQIISEEYTLSASETAKLEEIGMIEIEGRKLFSLNLKW